MSAIFASIIRQRMRANGVTIRALAKSMQLTIKRVREVRTLGTPPPWVRPGYHGWKQDWLDGIRNANTKEES